jgi:hypothetical protein
MNINIVVARYNENIEWVKQFKNVVIYNKGNPINDIENQVTLSNVGREGHTYYKYICDNYYNLPNYIIFLQGNPFDHSPNIIANIHKYVNNEKLYLNFEFLSEDIHYSTLKQESKRYAECKDIFNTFERVFKKTIIDDNECIFGAGAQFIVSKERILKRDIEFYKNIVNILEYSISPMEGYDIERLHKYIFI